MLRGNFFGSLMRRRCGRLSAIFATRSLPLYEMIVWLYVYVFLGFAPMSRMRLDADTDTAPGVNHNLALRRFVGGRLRVHLRRGASPVGSSYDRRSRARGGASMVPLIWLSAAVARPAGAEVGCLALLILEDFDPYTAINTPRPAASPRRRSGSWSSPSPPWPAWTKLMAVSTGWIWNTPTASSWRSTACNGLHHHFRALKPLRFGHDSHSHVPDGAG